MNSARSAIGKGESGKTPPEYAAITMKFYGDTANDSAVSVAFPSNLNRASPTDMDQFRSLAISALDRAMNQFRGGTSG